MDLHFTGRGAAFNVKEGNTNAYFVENEKLFMVDCGESMFAAINERNILPKIKEIYVLVSHTHSDHCGSLGSFGLYCQFVLHNKLKIIVPHNEVYVEHLRKLMTIFGNTSLAYEFLYEEEIDHCFDAFSTVRYELTKHDYMLTCYSFVFETKEGGLFYSADTRTTENMLNFINTHDKIDRIYMEATDLDIPEDIHMNLQELVKDIPESLKDKVYMMHLRGDITKKMIEELGLKIVDIYK